MAVLLAPGQNVAVPTPPTSSFNEFPKHMVHPGFTPGRGDKEIKLLDENGSPTGKVYYTGGQSVRFPPVLVFDASQQAQHEADGYTAIGKSDPAAFARAVASAMPAQLDYKPIEYPKWCHGKQVVNADEEREWLRELKINADGSPLIEGQFEDVTEQLRLTSEAGGEPALSTEIATLEVFPATEDVEIMWLETRLAELKAKQAPVEAPPPPELMGDAEAAQLAAANEAEAHRKVKSDRVKAGWDKRRKNAEAARRASAETD